MDLEGQGRALRQLGLDVIIYDIDGVLVDVSESYRNAIGETVQLYLEQGLGLEPYPGSLISPADVAAFKMAGGFNNDWDLTTGILAYELAQLDSDDWASTSAPAALPDIMTALRRAGARQTKTIAGLVRTRDIPAFARAVADAGGGLPAVKQLLAGRNAHLLFATGDLRHTNLVERIFQELYLGDEFFALEYGEPPLVHHGSGLIRRERLIASPGILAALGRSLALGIATGRPRSEARHALESAGIAGCFGALVAHEDVVQAEEQALAETGRPVRLGKPHPFPLLEAVRRITMRPVRCAYIGDTPDDVRAAQAARAEMNFVSIACLAPAADPMAMRHEFERLGADFIVAHPDELLAIVNG